MNAKNEIQVAKEEKVRLNVQAKKGPESTGLRWEQLEKPLPRKKNQADVKTNMRPLTQLKRDRLLGLFFLRPRVKMDALRYDSKAPGESSPVHTS